MKAIAGVFVAVGALLAALAMTGPVSAATIKFVVKATGAHEAPPVDGTAVANAEFRFNDETNELVYTVKVVGLRDYEVTGAHLHRGEPGRNGPVAFTLSDEGFVLATGSVTLSADDVAALMAGEFYLNIHSVEYPDGFARGQLIPPDGIVSSGDATAGDATSEVAGITDIRPPSTGDGGLAGRGGANLLPAAALVAIAVAGTGAVALRCRA